MRRLLRWLFLICAAACVAWLWIEIAPPKGSPTGDSELTVVSWNVRGLSYEGETTSANLVFSALKGADPDLLLLQEMSFGLRGGPLLERLADELGLVHQAKFQYGGDDWAGMAIVSRHPLSMERLTPLPPASAGRSLGRVRLLVDGRPLEVAVLHLANSDIHVFGKRASVFSEIFGSNLRTIQAEALLSELRGTREPLLVGGDFNTFPLSAAWRMIRAEYRDAFRPPELFRGTFRVNGDIEVKLDHIFLSPQIRVLEARVLDVAGSDHLPIRARIRF